MNGSELLVSALENEGVTQIFGLPGEENLAMVEALRRSSIKLGVTRHEQAAAFMAATHREPPRPRSKRMPRTGPSRCTSRCLSLGRHANSSGASLRAAPPVRDGHG